jgi:flagellar protein FliO/FliZ
MSRTTLTRGTGLAGAYTLLQTGIARAATYALPAHTAAGAAPVERVRVAARAATAGYASLNKAETTPLNLGSPSTVHSAAGGASLTRTIVGLFVVIAVIYGVSWLLRTYKKGAKQAATKGSGLATVATLPLGTGRSVQLVRAGREVLLLGVSEQGVTQIRSYTEEEALAQGIDLSEDEPDDRDGSARRVFGGGAGGNGDPKPRVFAAKAGAWRDARTFLSGPRPGGKLLDELRRMTIRS